MFGPHLTLDLYGCDKKKISSEKYIYNLLDKFPELIGMHKFTDPSISYYNGNVDSFDEGGFSGFVLIAESHIAIHCFPAQRFATIDIFSCKAFDTEKAENLMMKLLGAKKSERNLFNRGVDFPKQIDKSKVIVRKQRRRLSK